MNSHYKLSILIPVYNEEPQIQQVLERIYQVPYSPKEIIIVDDCSSDGTHRILEKYQNRPDTKVIYHKQNRGKGFAIRTALQNASGDILIIQDADLEYDPEEIPAVIAPIIEGKTKICYGSRFQGGLERMAIPNRVANWLLAKTISWLYWTNITDEATAYKSFKSEIIHPIRLNCEGFEFCPEVTAKVLRLGHTIQEVPVHFRARTVWEGKKIGWKDFHIAIWTMLRYRFAPLESFTHIPAHEKDDSGKVS